MELSFLQYLNSFQQFVRSEQNNLKVKNNKKNRICLVLFTLLINN